MPMGTGPKAGRGIIKGAWGDAGGTAATHALSSAWMRQGRHAPLPSPRAAGSLARPQADTPRSSSPALAS